MYKKFLCVILSVAMILSMVTLPGFAAGAADLSAGCVVYSDEAGNQIRSLTGGAAVKASTTIRNAGSADASAVVWVATYDNGVLVSTSYASVSVPKGQEVPVSVLTQAMPKDVSNVVVYTYIWDSFTNMNSLAPVATFPSSNTDVLKATVNGKEFTFDLEGDKKSLAMTEEEFNAGLAFQLVPADNSAKVEIPDEMTYLAPIPLKVTAADGTERIYTVTTKATLTADAGNKRQKVYSVPDRESMGTQMLIELSEAREKNGMPNTGNSEIKPFQTIYHGAQFYADRDFGNSHKTMFVTTGSKLLGATQISTFMSESNRTAGSVADFMAAPNEYYSFTANESGTVYVKWLKDIKNFEDAGWTKVNEAGSGIDTKMFQNYFGIPEGYTYNPADFPYFTNMVQVNNANGVYPSAYKVTYYKTFAAGEKVTIYTPASSDNQNIVTLIQWDDKPAPEEVVDVSLKSLSYNGISVPRFDPAVYKYDIMLETMSESFDFSWTLNNTEDEIAVSVVKNEATATDEFVSYTISSVADTGDTLTYVLNFNVIEPNTVFNLTKADKAGPLVVVENAQDKTTLCYSDRTDRYFSSDGTLTGATLIQRAKDDSKPVKFTDPGPVIEKGSLGQPYFGGDFTDANGGKIWFSFNVSSDAVVYMSDPVGKGWPDKTDGWKLTKDSDNPEIKAVQLYQGNAKGAVWYKEVSAGELVEIARYGAPEGWTEKDGVCWDPPLCAVQWKNAVGPTPTPTPTVTPTPTPTPTPSATPTPLPNTVYEMDYHGLEADKTNTYAIRPLKRSSKASVDDGTANPVWAYSTYINQAFGDASKPWGGQSWAIYTDVNTASLFENGTTISIDKYEAKDPTSTAPYYGGNYNGVKLDGTNGNYWMSFKVSSPATVYMVDRVGAGWFNKPDGWKYVSKDAGINVLSGNSGSPMYYKHYNKDELVQMPNYGFSEDWKPGVNKKTNDSAVYIVVWDELQPYNIAISSDTGVTVGTPVTLSAAMTKRADGAAVDGATFKWVITEGSDKATIDKETGVLTPNAAGTVTVAAAAADGSAIAYKDITISGPVTPTISNIKINPGRILGPAASSDIQTVGNGVNRGKLNINNKVHSDREPMTFAHVSSYLKDADTITVPLNDVRVSANARAQEKIDFMNGDNTYFTFDVNKDCTVYVMAFNACPNFTSEKGWVTVNNGTGLPSSIEIDGTTYTDLKKLPFDYNPTDLKYYVSRVQWQNHLKTEDTWIQDGTCTITDNTGAEKEAPCVSSVMTMKYVYAKNVAAGSTVEIPTPGGTTAALCPPNYPDAFAVAVKWETDTLVSVLSQTSEAGTEDIGEVTKTAASVEVAANGYSVSAVQDPMSTLVTVSGTSASANGAITPVVIYKPGKTPAMADAAVKSGASLDDIIAGAIQTSVKKNNTFKVNMNLAADAATGDCEIWAATEGSKAKTILSFVNPTQRLNAMAAIIDAANLTEGMEAALSTAILNHLGAIDGDIALFSALTKEGQEFVASIVADKIKTIDKTDITKYAELAAPIDEASALATLSEGKITTATAGLVIDKLAGTEWSTKAVEDYKGTSISDAGKSAIWSGMKRNSYYATFAEARAAFVEQVVVNAVANPGKNGVTDVVNTISRYRGMSELANCNWAGYDKIVSAGKAAQFAGKLSTKKPTSLATFVTKFNEAVPEITINNGSTDRPGGSTGGGTGGSSGTITVDPTPKDKKVDDFRDANDAVWAKPALQTMLDKKVFEGYEDETLRPNNNATREEVVKILVSTFYTVNKGAVSSFSDVSANDWFYSYVATGEANGITKGMGDGTFGVGRNITRQDFAVMIYNYMLKKGVSVDTTPYQFADNNAIASYARDAVYALKNANIIKGYEDNTMAPEGSATRAEIAQMMANLIVLLGL